MRFWFSIGMMASALLLLAGCGGHDEPAPEAGHLLEDLTRASATLEGRTASPAENPRVAAGHASGESASAPVSEVTPAGGHRPELAYTRRYYAYRSVRRRDPFEPLLTEEGKVDGITLDALTLTGILWDADESLVVLEDSRGQGYPLRVGDHLAGARLVAVRKDAAVFRIVEFGEARSVVKELFVAEEKPI